jgi:hypothetical protein
MSDNVCTPLVMVSIFNTLIHFFVCLRSIYYNAGKAVNGESRLELPGAARSGTSGFVGLCLKRRVMAMACGRTRVVASLMISTTAGAGQTFLLDNHDF